MKKTITTALLVSLLFLSASLINAEETGKKNQENSKTDIALEVFTRTVILDEKGRIKDVKIERKTKSYSRNENPADKRNIKKNEKAPQKGAGFKLSLEDAVEKAEKVSGGEAFGDGSCHTE